MMWQATETRRPQADSTQCNKTDYQGVFEDKDASWSAMFKSVT